MRETRSHPTWSGGVALIVLATAAAAWAQVPARKTIRNCPAPCTLLVNAAPGVTTVTYAIEFDTAPAVLQVTDDIPAGAIGFRVIDRGNRLPCGSPGVPTCANEPAPAGANGTGRVVINDFRPIIGPGGLRAIIVYEVDFACPPIANRVPIANQATIYTPTDPTICTPCRSDDPGTTAADDATVFTPVCQPPSDISIVKTVDPLTWTPGQSPVFNYKIVITNNSTTPLTPFGLYDYLPALQMTNPSSAWIPLLDSARTCPAPITVTPPQAAMGIDQSDCGGVWPNQRPMIRMWGFDPLLPGATLTIEFPVTIPESHPDQYVLCNTAELRLTTGAGPSARACLTVVLDQNVDFRSSLKTVTSADPVAAGDPVAYRLTVANTGNGPATAVRVDDVFDACLDTSTFNPATNVTVSPGPATVSYTPATRTLSVTLGTVAAGVVQTINVAGLYADGSGGACCNQARVYAAELLNPGYQPTVFAAGMGAQTCLTVIDQKVDFGTSLKTVTSADPVEPGDPVAYRLAVANTGNGPATAVRVEDAFASCLDVTTFNPATDVTVSPGPSSVSYVPGTRTLTVTLGAVAAGLVQTIDVGGLRAAGPDGTCCNQARVFAAELPAPGYQETGSLAGVGAQTCVDVLTVGCDLNRALLTVRGPVGPGVYTGVCSVPPRLPGPAFVGSVVTDTDVDGVDPGVPGFALALYQLDCACSDTIRLVKDVGAVPHAVRLVY